MGNIMKPRPVHSINGPDATMHVAQQYRHRIAITDNDERSLESLRDLVERNIPRSYVIWTCSSERETIERCLACDGTIDLLLLDMSMERMQGPSICRRIREQTWRVPILAMTSFSLHRYREQAVYAGAQGITSKNDEQAIIRSINEVLRSKALDGFESSAVAYTRISNERPHQQLLTSREEEIINLAADSGLTDRQIAEELNIAEATVRRHMHNILAKLGAKTARQAIARWLTPR